jgi:hypothetical protein
MRTAHTSMNGNSVNIISIIVPPICCAKHDTCDTDSDMLEYAQRSSVCAGVGVMAGSGAVVTTTGAGATGAGPVTVTPGATVGMAGAGGAAAGTAETWTGSGLYVRPAAPHAIAIAIKIATM